MPEFMTNLRAACVKLRGAVGNAALPKPEHFRSSALQRDERLFEHGLTDEVLEENVSKGDAAYESAWIDKLLKDSDESCSESEENPVVARKSSVDLEASERIRKGEHVVPFLDPVDVGKPLDSFNSPKVIDETTDKTNFNNFANKCLDDIDERDAQNNKFQEDTLHMYDAEKSGSERRIKPLQDKPTVSSPVNFEDVLVPSMDKNTLNPTNVNDETLEPKPDVLSAVLSSPVNSPMRSELLEDDENKIDADQMNNNRSEEPGKYSNFLLDSEQIASSSGYIEHEMELLLYEEKDISVQSTLLEHKFREVEAEGVQCEELLHLWFHLVTRKNVAFHRRLMLDILQSEQDLEKKCELLQTELRRGDIDEVGEKLLLEELLKVVDMRDQLVMARDREEISLQEEVELGKEVETKMTNAQDERKDKCKMQ